jgi:hypothetical protein
MLDRLLTNGAVSERGTYYAAEEARHIPGCVQRPAGARAGTRGGAPGR